MDLSGAGGVETHILQLAQEMRKLGVDVDVFGKHRGDGIESIASFEPHNYAIINTHGCSLDLTLCRKLLRCTPDQRRVHTLHGISLYYLWACKTWLNWRCYWATLIEQILSSQADHVICVSHNIHEGAQQYFGINDSKLSVITNGVNGERFHNKDKAELRKGYGLNPDDLVVVFVGRGEDRVKGTTAIAQSINELSKEFGALRLLAIPGSGFESASWLCKTGEIAHERISDGYAAADIFVNASLNEGMPITLLEAMAAGLAIVVSPVGGIPEVVRHEENGLLLQPDRSDLTDQLRRLLIDEGLRNQLGQRGQEDVLKLSWKNAAKQTIDLYQGLLS